MLLGRPLMTSRFWEEGVTDGDNTSNKNRDTGGRGKGSNYLGRHSWTTPKGENTVYVKHY